MHRDREINASISSPKIAKGQPPINLKYKTNIFLHVKYFLLFMLLQLSQFSPFAPSQKTNIF